MDSHIATAARTLWSFHCVYDEPIPSDVIIGLGSYDTRVADRCAQLFHAGLAPQIVFTGASGNWTEFLFPDGEAVAFGEIALVTGVPGEVITLETKATNLGENIRFSSRIAPDATRVVFVTKPQTQLRCRATARKQWPGVHALVTAPLTAYEDQPLLHHDERALICEMVGDLNRLRSYPDLGFQAEVAIPHEVWRAYDVLVDAGFVDHLPARQ